MATQVGVGEVAIVPTIKGFRRAVTSEVDSATKEAKGAFEKGFASAGTKAGTDSGKGFHSAFGGETKKTVEQLTKSMRSDVAKAAREVSQARLKEQDAAGKVRVAEAQLAETRKKYAADSSQVVRAEERLQAAQRTLAARQEDTKSATDKLSSAQDRLAEATDKAERELKQVENAANDAQGGFGDLTRSADRAGTELGSVGDSGGKKFSGGIAAGIGKAAPAILAAVAALGIGSMISNVIDTAVSSVISYVQESVSAASSLEQSMGAVDAIFKENAETIKAWSAESAQSVGLSQVKYQEFATVVGAQLKNMGLPMSDVVAQTGNLISLGADLSAQFGGPTSDAVDALSSALRGERDPIERYGVSIKQADINARLAAKGLSELEGDALKAAEANETLAMIYEQTADASGTFARESDTLAGQQQRLTAEWENAQAKLGTSLMPTLTELAKIANDELVPVLNEVIDQVGPELGDAVKEAAPSLIELANAVAENLPKLIEMGTDVLPIIVDALETITPFLMDVADAWGVWGEQVGALLGWLSGDSTLSETAEELAGISGSSGSVLDAISNLIIWFNDFSAVVTETVGPVVAWLSEKWVEVQLGLESVRQFFADIWAQIGLALGGALQFIVGLITGNMDLARQGLDQFLGAARSIWQSVAGAFQSGVNTAVSFVAGLPGQILSALSGAGSWLYSVGRDIVQGLINGVNEMVSSAIRAVENLGSSMVDRVKSFLGIASPSKVFRQLGVWTGEGLVLGLDSQRTKVGASSERLADQVVSAFPSGQERALRARVAAAMDVTFDAVSAKRGGGAAGLGGVTVQAPVAVKMLERDPRRVGRAIGRGVEEILGAI
ncbi:phage tail protein [Leucobacter ruminantium]|uniref:Phage-related protein n=1 Tax=Leucobacter ruminantium TaxID=1289170 RepID=A0A939RUJ0_9MICO|nr:hypothetical protein [Leucobacter ruminantium]MBO1805835.1 hypothetical protein [Leucobacter ruminantium]